MVTGRESPTKDGARAAAPPKQSAGPGAANKIRLHDQGSTSAQASETPRSGTTHSLAVVASLSIVLGLFFVVVWFLRRSMPSTGRRLPNEVVELLGFAALAHRQQVQLVRLGNKLLLISLTPSGAETLSEVSDPAEVERLTGLSRKSSHSAATSASPFRQIFDQFRRESTAPPILAKLPAMQPPPKPGQERARAV